MELELKPTITMTVEEMDRYRAYCREYGEGEPFSVIITEPFRPWREVAVTDDTLPGLALKSLLEHALEDCNGGAGCDRDYRLPFKDALEAVGNAVGYVEVQADCDFLEWADNEGLISLAGVPDESVADGVDCFIEYYPPIVHHA